jgi:chromosome partitioning protein
MARTIAFANQKGGVAKTTSTLAIGASLAQMGSRALLVDLDPQGCLTYSLGVDSDALDLTIHDVLVGRVPVGKTIHQLPEVDLVPANIDLAGAEAYLLTRTGREYALRTALEDVQIHYDWILLDCPPSLGVLTINALTAADAVIIPMQCEALSHRGVGQLLETIDVLPTLYDSRTQHAQEILDDVGRRYRLPVLEPPIRKSIRFAEAPRAGRSIIKFAPSHNGAESYRQIARSLLDAANAATQRTDAAQ